MRRLAATAGAEGMRDRSPHFHVSAGDGEREAVACVIDTWPGAICAAPTAPAQPNSGRS